MQTISVQKADFEAVLESCNAILNYSFVKASAENSAFSLKTFNNVLERAVAFKKGQAVSEGAVDALVNRVGNLAMIE